MRRAGRVEGRGLRVHHRMPPFKLTAKLNKLTLKLDRPQLSEKDIQDLKKKMLEKD